MTWLSEVLGVASVSHFIAVIAFVVAVGMALGRVTIFGVSLRAAFVLLVGIVVGHYGMQFPELLQTDEAGVRHFLDPDILHFLQEFGLVLFVYAVGLQSGKQFFHVLAHGGLKLNVLAATVVALNVAIAIAIHYVCKIDMPTVVGILSGAVTNTPGLGAAQSVCQNSGVDPSVLASAYAAAYPLGVLGIIFTLVGIRFAFRIDLDAENLRLQAEKEASQKNAPAPSVPKTAPVIQIFVGILLGVILGSIPIHIPGVPQPLKFGIAGGSLIVAILLSAFGEKIKFPTQITTSANALMRVFGICLFLACVGLKAGETFVETIVNGGLVWVGLGAIVTIVPLAVVGVVGYAVCKVDYFTLMAVIAGSMTDPPALSYSVGTAKNDLPTVGYSTVYPLIMFLRIMTAEILVILFA